MPNEIDDLALAKQSFEDVARAFKVSLETKPVPDTAGPPSLWDRIGKAVEALVSSKISYLTAAKGYEASFDAINKLAIKAGEDNDMKALRKYTACMKAAHAEYVKAVEKGLDDAPYEKITNDIKAAAGELKAALQRTKDLKDSLNLASTVVSAFSKLIPLL